MLESCKKPNRKEPNFSINPAGSQILDRGEGDQRHLPLQFLPPLVDSCADVKSCWLFHKFVKTGKRNYSRLGSLLDTIQSRIERRPDVLESELWDAEGQKLSGLALVRFVVS